LGAWLSAIKRHLCVPPTYCGQKDKMNNRFHDLSLMQKRILLVDSNPKTRDSRAKTLRSRGVVVHCAATGKAARTRCASTAYNMVLLDLGVNKPEAEQLAKDIRAANPRQLLRFLVGSPFYVARSPGPTPEEKRGKSRLRLS